MLAKIEEFMSTPAGRFLGMAGLAILTAVLTYIAAQTVNRLMRKLVDRQRKSGSSLATVTGFVRYIAVAAVYFAGGMVIIGAIPLLSSAVHTLLTAGGVIAVVAGLAAQEALGSVVSGVMILLFKPFKMGDVVRYVDSDITGTVGRDHAASHRRAHSREQARYHPEQQDEQRHHRKRRLRGQPHLRVPDRGRQLQSDLKKGEGTACSRGSAAAELSRCAHRTAEA